MFLMKDLFIDTHEKHKRKQFMKSQYAASDTGVNPSRLAEKSAVYRGSSSFIKSKNNIQWQCCSVVLMNLRIRLPKLCRIFCCKRSRSDEVVIKTYRKLEKEVTITNILKQIRILRMLTTKSLGPRSWRQALGQDSLKEYKLTCTSSEEEYDH